MSPLASQTLGPWLYSLTGKWNLEDYLGHDCYIVAASAVVYNTVGRLEQDDAMQQRFRRHIELPATLCIPLLLAAFWMGNGAEIYRPDFFDVPTDLWLNLYWLMLCGMLIYLLGYGSRALLILRTDPRSRPIANVYLFASVMGILACLVRVITAFVPALQTVQGSTLVWIFACACGAGFALTSAHSWRIKTKWFSNAGR